jgi:hypothetical protein
MEPLRSTNSFYKNIEDFNSTLDAYQNGLANLAASGHHSLDEEIGAIMDLDLRLQFSLCDMEWTIKTLRSDLHLEILHAALEALNGLNIPLMRMQDRLCKLEAQSKGVDNIALNNELRVLNDLQGPYAEMVLTCVAKIQRVAEERSLLPMADSLSSSTQIASSHADLALHSSRGYLPYQLAPTFYDSMIFTPGKFYNPIPAAISSYRLRTIADLPERLLPIFSQMSIPEELHESDFRDADGTVYDRYGEKLLAPSGFAADLLRIEEFVLDGQVLMYKDRELRQTLALNPNDAARTLFEQFGKLGAQRLMLLCNQNAFADLLIFLVMPELENGGTFQKTLGGRDASFGQDSGLSFRISTDIAKDLVTVAMKCLMKANGPDFENGQNPAHCVIKTTVQLPYSSLISTNFEQQTPELLGLHITDTLSTLILNNPPEANELFKKF